MFASVTIIVHFIKILFGLRNNSVLYVNADSDDEDFDSVAVPCENVLQTQFSDEANIVRDGESGHVYKEMTETTIDDVYEGTRFDPPLYRQRYRTVADILEHHAVKTVVDLGCSEHKVIPVYKAVATIENITGVDLDLDALKCNEYLLRPLVTDYLIRRERPLTVRLYQGDAGCYDNRMAGTEAVTLIEVIEHLYAETLQSVSHNVFRNIRPRLVIITTPNSEYNVLFGEMAGFRHWDHKFEWTRQQFQSWCSEQADRYGYTVTYSGVGEPPESRSHIGHCSQLAVFTIVGDWSPTTADLTLTTPYTLVSEWVHPHQEHSYSTSETITMETKYYLHVLANQLAQEEGGGVGEEEGGVNECYLDDASTQLLVTPAYLLRFSRISKLCDSPEQLRDVLVSEGFELTPNNTHVVYHLPSDTSSEDSDLDDIPTAAGAPGELLCTNQETKEVFENWDVDLT